MKVISQGDISQKDAIQGNVAVGSYLDVWDDCKV